MTTAPPPTTPVEPVDPAGEAVAVVGGPPQYWSALIRDRWFFGGLALATMAVLVLFTPFLYVLMLATILVVVTWPIYERILRRLDGRRIMATVLMLLILVVGVVVPVGLALVVFVRQSLSVVQATSAWVKSGGLDALVGGVQDDLRILGQHLGFEVDLATTLGAPLQDLAFGALQRASTGLPGLVGATAGLGIDSVIFLFATASLYLEGPKLLQVIRNLVPMDDRYENKLFAAFRRLANNMVLGSVVTGLLQGVVAAIGFAIAGVEQVVFLGILTAVGSFIPLIGTALVWVPVTLYVFAVDGWGWGLFIVLWSVLLTASVDNFLKPLFLRGGTQIHPLLIFLGVFSGLAWMGVPGVLVGPVIVAFFMAMYTSYLEDFLLLPAAGARELQSSGADRGVLMPTPAKTEPPVTPMETEPLVPAEPPVTTEPLPPLGATYEAKATKMDSGSYHEIQTKELGPEFPVTPAARSHAVTEEQLPDKAVLDHGTSLEETGPPLPSAK